MPMKNGINREKRRQDVRYQQTPTSDKDGDEDILYSRISAAQQQQHREVSLAPAAKTCCVASIVGSATLVGGLVGSVWLSFFLCTATTGCMIVSAEDERLRGSFDSALRKWQSLPSIGLTMKRGTTVPKHGPSASDFVEGQRSNFHSTPTKNETIWITVDSSRRTLTHEEKTTSTSTAPSVHTANATKSTPKVNHTLSEATVESDNSPTIFIPPLFATTTAAIDAIGKNSNIIARDMWCLPCSSTMAIAVH